MRQEALAQELETLSERLPELQAASRAAQQSEREALRALTEAHASPRSAAAHPEKSGRARRTRELAERFRPRRRPPLRQKLKVEAGWELAIEAVLRERFAALCLEDPERARASLGDEAPAAVLLAWPCAAPALTLAGNPPGVLLAIAPAIDSAIAGTVGAGSPMRAQSRTSPSICMRRRIWLPASSSSTRRAEFWCAVRWRAAGCTMRPTECLSVSARSKNSKKSRRCTTPRSRRRGPDSLRPRR